MPRLIALGKEGKTVLLHQKGGIFAKSLIKVQALRNSSCETPPLLVRSILFFGMRWIYLRSIRDVAQPGSALRSGRRGRWFESSHPDPVRCQKTSKTRKINELRVFLSTFHRKKIERKSTLW